MALTAWAAYVAAAPAKANSCTQTLLVAKGIGTTEVYMLEIDPVTGQLPVSLSSVVDFGASATALRTASLVGNATGAALFGAGAVGAQVLRTTPASDSPHLLATRHEAAATPLSFRPSDGTNFAAFGAGAVGATVQRTTPASDSPHLLATRHEAAGTPISVRLSDGSTFPANGLPPGGRSKAFAFFRQDYTSTSITTLAYTEVHAAAAGVINRMHIFDSSGQTLKMATGNAGSEVDAFLIPPGGIDIDFLVPTATRLSVKAVSAAATAGEIDINFLT